MRCFCIDKVYDFGLLVKELRDLKNLSQKELADRIGVNPKAISTYENNTRMPSLEKIKKLAIIFNVSLDYLLGFDNRTNIYIDDLPKDKQDMIIEIVKVIRSK